MPYEKIKALAPDAVNFLFGFLWGISVLTVLGAVEIYDNNTAKPTVNATQKTFQEPALTAEDLKQQQCIQEVLYYEARGEGTVGILAVLSVVQNRLRSKRWGTSWCSVVHAPWQFSYRNEGTFGEPFQEIPKIPEFIKELSEEAVKGKFRSILEPSVLYYHSTVVKPHWSAKFKQVTVINKHIFYKEL